MTEEEENILICCDSIRISLNKIKNNIARDFALLKLEEMLLWVETCLETQDDGQIL